MSNEAAAELLQEKERALQELAAAKAFQVQMLKQWETQLAQLKVTNASLQEALAWRESQLKASEESTMHLENVIAQLRQTIASNEAALAWRAEQVEQLEQGLANRDETIRVLSAQLEAIQRES